MKDLLSVIKSKINANKRLVLLLFFCFFLSFLYLTIPFPSYQPQKIKLSNCSDSSVTISWITKKAVKGWVVYAENRWQTEIPLLNLLLSKKRIDDHGWRRQPFISFYAHSC